MKALLNIHYQGRYEQPTYLHSGERSVHHVLSLLPPNPCLPLETCAREPRGDVSQDGDVVDEVSTWDNNLGEGVEEVFGVRNQLVVGVDLLEAIRRSHDN